MTPAVDFGRRFRSAREALLDLLWDQAWHGCKALERVAGNRYSARLLELRRLGYQIETRDEDLGRIYRLASLERGEPQARRVKCFLDEGDAAWAVEGILTPAARRSVGDALASFRSNRGKL